jgi:hypothetical protein
LWLWITKFLVYFFYRVLLFYFISTALFLGILKVFFFCCCMVQNINVFWYIKFFANILLLIFAVNKITTIWFKVPRKKRKWNSRKLQKNNLAVVLCSPTGSGKTVAFNRHSAKALSFIVMIAVDRTELWNRQKNKLIDYGLNPAIITAGRSKRNASSYVATVQAVKRVFHEINLFYYRRSA